MIYYTDNNCKKHIALKVRQVLTQIARNKNMSIISVSLKPIDFGLNIVMPFKRGNLTMFRQILTGIQNTDADIIFFTEHDIIYHESHFDFTPPEKNVFYYNQNIWSVDTITGQALFYYLRQTCNVCVFRDVAIKHYRNRIDRIEKEPFTRRMGYEPGTHKAPRGFDQYTSGLYWSKHPNVDIRHTTNLTGKRFKKEQYRNQKNLKGWTLANEIPFWGKTKGRFNHFLSDIKP